MAYKNNHAFAVKSSLNLHEKILSIRGRVKFNRFLITSPSKRDLKVEHAIYHCSTDYFNRIKSCPILRGAINRTEI
jgi:hypothetical protein